MVKLFTDRLIIRDPVFSDLQNHHELISNNNVMRYTQKMKPDSIEDSKKELLKAIEEAKLADRKLYTLIIENKITNEFIGEIGYKVSQDTPYGKLINLWYLIKEEYWNNGYTTEALKHLIKYAFEENNVYRISTGCIKENIGSEKVMIKGGLKKEAELREYVFHEGKLKDWVDYGLLKKEWKE